MDTGEHFDVAARSDRIELLELELPGRVDGDDRELGPGARSNVLPGDEVRVVFRLRGHGDVSRAQVVEPPAVGDEVERRRDVVGEDDLARRLRVDERTHL